MDSSKTPPSKSGGGGQIDALLKEEGLRIRIGMWTSRSRLEDLRHYVEVLESFISTAESGDLSALDAEAAAMEEDARDEFLAFYAPYQWNDVFRGSLRSSALISLMSLVEEFVHELCDIAASVLGSELTYRDLRGGTLDAARRFLKVFAPQLYATDEQWKALSDIYAVRNVFVHSGGWASRTEDKRAIRRLSGLECGLRTSRHGPSGSKSVPMLVELGKEFLPFAITVSQEVLDSLGRSLKEFHGDALRFSSR